MCCASCMTLSNATFLPSFLTLRLSLAQRQSWQGTQKPDGSDERGTSQHLAVASCAFSVSLFFLIQNIVSNVLRDSRCSATERDGSRLQVENSVRNQSWKFLFY